MTANRVTLRAHLESFGLQHFDSEDYWVWGGKELHPQLLQELERLRRPVQTGNPTGPQLRRFIDFIADPKIAAVVNSMQADALRACGEAIASRLTGSNRVLDVGCGLGYLTTFYALSETSRQVLGLDQSLPTIKRARSLAVERGIRNVAYDPGDITRTTPQGDFDVVACSQTLARCGRRTDAFRNMSSCLRSDGRMICVERLSNAEEAATFIDEAHDIGLGLIEFDVVYHSDLGDYSFYPCLVFSKSRPGISIPLQHSYEDARRVCAMHMSTRHIGWYKV